MALAFDRLDPSAHDRASFSCGETSLDNYLKRQATQDMRSRVAVCYVLHEQGSPAIIGYYTLSAIAIEPRQVPPGLIRRLPRYPQLPAALLGRLAVATKYQGEGHGDRLLADAVGRASAAEVGVMALVVDALDDRAAGFYRHYGFVAFIENPLRLFLMLGPVRERT